MYVQLHLDDCVKQFSDYLKRNGYRIGTVEAIQYGFQLPIVFSKISVHLRIYNQSKKPGWSKIDLSLVRLKMNQAEQTSSIKALIDQIQNWVDSDSKKCNHSVQATIPHIQHRSLLSKKQPFISHRSQWIPHIGVDESGKGDYFGPLVVVAFFIADFKQEQTLKLLGIRDSKTLSDSLIFKLAPTLLSYYHCIQIKFPKRYNNAYNQCHNLNILLGECHAEVIDGLSRRTHCLDAISDQFGKEHRIQDVLNRMGRSDIRLKQQFHAESDIAVACASVLARFYFLKYLQRVHQICGIRLPKGASANLVVTAGKKLVRQYGDKILCRLAKKHFKTTQQIFE